MDISIILLIPDKWHLDKCYLETKLPEIRTISLSGDLEGVSRAGGIGQSGNQRLCKPKTMQRINIMKVIKSSENNIASIPSHAIPIAYILTFS